MILHVFLLMVILRHLKSKQLFAWGLALTQRAVHDYYWRNVLIKPFWTTCAGLLILCSAPFAQALERHDTRANTAAANPHKSRHHALNRRAQHPVVIIPTKPSFGQLAGLHDSSDGLSLKSSVAYVIDQDTHEVLLSKNDQAVLPIASITKLMTGILVSEGNLDMNETITITDEDIDTEKNSSSRLKVGTSLPRLEMLHLALMASENRAAHALGRTFPGGLESFVQKMNEKADLLGMKDTHYHEPTGLSSKNQSSAKDLATLVGHAYQDPLLREFTTSPSYTVEVGNRLMSFHTTNRLVKNPNWDIGLQKTGFINEAGQCLVMQTKIAGRHLIMVLLDSAGRLSRIADAERVRHWVEAYHSGIVPQS
jgi:D-alanyl-D-alanine endopeptidase (penicillin-binding protein 7)